jgi:hypothetical protein
MHALKAGESSAKLARRAADQYSREGDTLKTVDILTREGYGLLTYDFNIMFWPLFWDLSS